jgi:hypothetical protein
MPCMLLIDTNEAARPAGGPPNGTPRPRGTTCSRGVTPARRRAEREPLPRVAEATGVRGWDGRAQRVWLLQKTRPAPWR